MCWDDFSLSLERFGQLKYGNSLYCDHTGTFNLNVGNMICSFLGLGPAKAVDNFQNYGTTFAIKDLNPGKCPTGGAGAHTISQCPANSYNTDVSACTIYSGVYLSCTNNKSENETPNPRNHCITVIPPTPFLFFWLILGAKYAKQN